MLNSLLLACAHAPGFAYVLWPLGDPLWRGPNEAAEFCAHLLIGVASAVGTLGPLLALVLAPLKEVALVALLIQVAWLGITFQNGPTIAKVILSEVPFGLGLGARWVHIIHLFCAAVSLSVYARAKSVGGPGRKSMLQWVILLLITASHTFAAVTDSQHLIAPQFLRNGTSTTGELLPVEVLVQTLVGIAHFGGSLSGILAVMGIVSTKTVGVSALVPQAVWSAVMLRNRSAWEALLDPKGLDYQAVLGIHIAQSILAVILLLWPSPQSSGRPARATKSKRE